MSLLKPIKFYKPNTNFRNFNINSNLDPNQISLDDRATNRQFKVSLKKYKNYNIKADANKEMVRIKARDLRPSYSINEHNLMKTGSWLQENLPIRLAKVVLKFRKLPFHVAIQEDILKTHETYLQSYNSIKNLKQIRNWQNLLDFTNILREKLYWHNDTLGILVKGFSEVFEDLDDNKKSSSLQKSISFLDEILAERLALRLLSDHHIKCFDYYTDKNKDKNKDRDRIGMFLNNFDPEIMVKQIFDNQLSVCIEEYGAAPEIKIESPKCTVKKSTRLLRHDPPDDSNQFRYIPDPLEYALKEILKNSMRAHIKAHIKDEEFSNRAIERMPAIKVIIIQNDEDFIIKISDRGNGIPHDHINQIWNYGFTVEDEKNNDGTFVNMKMQNSKSMHGYGFGLPVSKVYIEKMGGKVHIETMQNYGTDTYIRLPYMDRIKKNGFYKDIEL